MKKFITLAVGVALMAGLPAIGHAQTTAKSKNTTSSGAVAGAEAVGAIFMPGAIGGGGAGAGAAAAAASATTGWNQPQLIMNSTNAPSTGTFNDCGIAWSGAIWLVSASSTSESKECVAQREAIFAASILGDKALAFERMCDNENFRKAAARRSGQQCAATVAEQEKNRPVTVASIAPTPVVAAGSTPQCFNAAGQPVPIGQPGAVRCQ